VRYLIDTCVASDARRRDPVARDWLLSVDADDAFLSVMTLGEIEKGIALISRRDVAAGRSLAAWLNGLRVHYDGRILAIDDDVAVIWGRLAADRSRPTADALIAATAIAHGLSVVTRNVADFADTGVHITNPWAG